MSEPRTSERIVDPVLRSWLHEDRHEDVSRVAGAVLDLLDTTPQRRSPWWPARRFPFMNKFVSLGLGAAAVVVALVIGIRVFGPSAPGGVGGASLPSPTPAPTTTTAPSPSSASATPLTQSFTSALHGISLSYPEGWSARAATVSSTDRPAPYEFVDPGRDVLYHPTLTDHLFLDIVSQPIGDSAPEDWVAAQMTSDGGCPASEPITIDGATGLIGKDDCKVAAVTTAGRAYRISLDASNDDPAAVAAYDKGWFENVLSTVKLHPEDAVDAKPSPSP